MQLNIEILIKQTSFRFVSLLGTFMTIFVELEFSKVSSKQSFEDSKNAIYNILANEILLRGCYFFSL